MTVKEEIHRLIDGLPEDQAELVKHWLEDLRNASDAEGDPLDPKALASLDRGLKDIAEGRVKPLEEYERERGL